VALLNWIVIPCYNEAGRLEDADITALLSAPSVNVVLVDDGSTDTTLARCETFKSNHGNRVEILSMPENVGKAEAVRRGMKHAVSLGADITGYTDADFATRPAEMLRLVREIETDEATQVLLGSRWLHMGANIQRSAFRHYTGRVFATFASLILRMPVYDTQCGAKLFRVTETLTAAIADPFLSRWAFDVELIGRLREGVHDAPGYELSAFVEMPLSTWIDVRGSKIGVFAMIGATMDLLAIARELARLRRVRS